MTFLLKYNFFLAKKEKIKIPLGHVFVVCFFLFKHTAACEGVTVLYFYYCDCLPALNHDFVYIFFYDNNMTTLALMSY